ncbi:MAG: hypothetical protein WA742_09155 [Candidatus Cybelea sp.]
MSDRDQILELVMWALAQPPGGRTEGELVAEATDLVDAFLKDGALPAQGRRKREKGEEE